MKLKCNHGITKPVLLLILFLILNTLLWAEDSTAADTIKENTIIPAPDPFSLDAGSAVYCINLLKTSRYLEKEEDPAEHKIIEVETVWSWFLDFDESYPEGFRKRYDIIVNGKPLDWDNSYIEYGGELINLRLLFLYRNQYPPREPEYYYNPES